MGFIEEMNEKDDKTLLLTTHYIENENLCDEVAIIDDGKIIAQGSQKDLIANDGESQINITVTVGRSLLQISIQVSKIILLQ